MKKFLKFSGIVAFVLGLVAFILLMATAGVTFKAEGALITASGEAAGTTVLFGKTETVLGVKVVTKAAPTALIAWILIIVALLALCLAIVAVLLKSKSLSKFAGLLNVCAALALVVAGVLLFFTVASFTGANDVSKEAVKYYHLGGGYVVAAILALLGGVVALLPAASELLGKKK